MDSEAFRKHGKEMIDFVADYWDNIKDRKPVPNVQPCFMKELVPSEPPHEGEDWDAIFGDLNRVVVDNNTHWHHPHFFAYYPTANSYQAILGDILSAGLAPIGFTWMSSPSCTELEMSVTDWYAKMLGLPEHFLHSHPGPGAGIIQCTASDASLVAMLAARAKAVKMHSASPSASPAESVATTTTTTTNATGVLIEPDSTLFPNLIAYCSDQAHSAVDKNAVLCGVKLRKLATDSKDDFELQSHSLVEQIRIDRQNGLIPFFVLATVGSTPTCAVDDVQGLGKIANAEGMWIHVDAAYAGSAAVCPEFRYLVKGAELVDSFNFNAHKWLMVNFDCSPMWFRDATEAQQYFNVDPIFLKHKHQSAVMDYRHLQTGLGRRFRSLKAWFVIRSNGVKGLQEHIRRSCALAKEFAALVEADEEFEFATPPHLGLVCFRLKGVNMKTQQLYHLLTEDGSIHMVPATAGENYFLRFSISSTKTDSNDVEVRLEYHQTIS